MRASQEKKKQGSARKLCVVYIYGTFWYPYYRIGMVAVIVVLAVIQSDG
jgi:hypothetical protein